MKTTQEKVEYKMPTRFVNASLSNTCIGELYHVHDYFGKDQDQDKGIFGYRLPEFQRPPVWSEAQQIRFVESCWLELPIGSYMVNMNYEASELDGLLLDGQQRIRALYAYNTDKFPVFGYYYSELTKYDIRRWRMIPFPRLEVRENDIDRLKEIYNRFNFGGTPHTIGQMAKPSKKGIDRYLPNINK